MKMYYIFCLSLGLSPRNLTTATLASARAVVVDASKAIDEARLTSQQPDAGANVGLPTLTRTYCHRLEWQTLRKRCRRRLIASLPVFRASGRLTSRLAICNVTPPP